MDWIKSIVRSCRRSCPLRPWPLAARVREQMALAMEALGATVFPLPAPDEAAGERQRP